MSVFKLTLKQQMDIDTRKLYLNSKDKKLHQNSLTLNDKNYSELLVSIITSNLLVYTDDKLGFNIHAFINNGQWLQDTCQKIFLFKKKSILYQVTTLKKFIEIFEKCIKADLINIKQLMKFNERQLNFKSLMDYSSAFSIEIFEAPENHMQRIWNLKTARIILDEHPNLAKNYMGNILCLNKAIYMETHKLLSKTDFSNKVFCRYYRCYNSNRSVKLMKYLIDNNIKLADLNDPDFDEEEFTQNIPKENTLSLNIRDLNHDANDEVPLIDENQGITNFEDSDTEIEIIDHIDKRKKTDTNSTSNWGKLLKYIDDSKKPFIKTLDSSTQTDVEQGSNVLSENLSKLYSSGKLADVSLIGADRKFKVHSSVLGCYSEKFIEQFENNIKTIDLSNTSVATVEAMLQYMYKNKIDNLDEVAIDLLTLAYQYAIKNLIDICVKNLLQNIKVENASEIALTAHKCKCEQLMEDTKKFIASHIKEIIQTEGFNKLRFVEPNLAFELFYYQVQHSEKLP